jgi:hypothetical protein
MRGTPAIAVLLLAALCLALPANAGPGAGAEPSDIVIDGRFEDWSPGDLLYDSAPNSIGDVVAAAGHEPAIIRIWARGDRDRIAMSFELSREVLLQRDSGLVLYLDTDWSPATGTAVDGIGADLRWSFGEKEGRAFVMGLPLMLKVRRAHQTVSATRSVSLIGGRPSPGAARAGDSLAIVRVGAATEGRPPSPRASSLAYRQAVPCKRRVLCSLSPETRLVATSSRRLRGGEPFPHPAHHMMC